MPSSFLARVIQGTMSALNRALPAVLTADSPYYLLHIADEHIHAASRVYPTLANGAQLTAGAAWTLGAFVEIVPASTIASDFDIHHLSIEALSAVEVYEIELYYGAGDTFAGAVRVTKAAQLEGTSDIPFQTPMIPANSRIRGKVATEGGSDTCTLSIKYHTY